MHGKSFLSPLISLLVVSSSALAQQDAFPTLHRGTPVVLQLDQNLSSANARVGQRVAFEVTSDLVVNGQVIIPAGAAALGTVSEVGRHLWIARSGRLSVDVNVVRLPSGQVVPLATAMDLATSPGGGSEDLLGINLAPAETTNALTGPTVPKGTIIHAFVRTDTRVVQQTASASNPN